MSLHYCNQVICANVNLTKELNTLPEIEVCDPGGDQGSSILQGAYVRQQVLKLLVQGLVDVGPPAVLDAQRPIAVLQLRMHQRGCSGVDLYRVCRRKNHCSAVLGTAEDTSNVINEI